MNQLKELLDELDMESWLDHEGVAYKRNRGTRGMQANIRECPACGNSKWKVYFGLETGLGNCFVCDVKFTKWKFIAAHLGANNADVAAYIETYMRTQGWKPKVASTAPVLVSTLRMPESLPLPINGRNLKYLENRNVTGELARYFHLRYCHTGRFDYTNPEGRPAFQDYSRRIVIPIFDADGALASFQGRDITGESDRRYLFPPGFAATGSILYNAQNAAEAQTLVVGEGVFDCIAIKAALDADHELRDHCAVASFGKKLGIEQMDKLRLMQEKGKLKVVIFMWDAEQEALDAAVDAAISCKARGLITKIAVLPPGRDPNEVAPSVVLEAIAKAIVINPLSAITMKLKALGLGNSHD